jgi:hypothetical protein
MPETAHGRLMEITDLCNFCSHCMESSGPSFQPDGENSCHYLSTLTSATPLSYSTYTYVPVLRIKTNVIRIRILLILMPLRIRILLYEVQKFSYILPVHHCC